MTESISNPISGPERQATAHSSRARRIGGKIVKGGAALGVAGAGVATLITGFNAHNSIDSDPKLNQRPPAATAAPSPEYEGSTTTAPNAADIKAFADATEQNKFRERLEEVERQLAVSIIEAYENGEGNSANNFYSFVNEDGSYDPFEAGTGSVNVHMDAPTNGTGIGEYGLGLRIVRNPDGTFDLGKIGDIHVFEQVNSTGLNGPGADRTQVRSVSFNSDAGLFGYEQGSDRFQPDIHQSDVQAGGDSIEQLETAFVAAQEIINNARAGTPINS